MGAQRSQLVAVGGKWDGRENGSDKRKPLPWVATGCLNGKEGVDGSSPSEGSAISLLISSFRRETHPKRSRADSRQRGDRPTERHLSLRQTAVTRRALS